jgi:hypothetical protein
VFVVDVGAAWRLSFPIPSAPSATGERSLGLYQPDATGVRDTARATSQERDFLREKERDVSSNFEG